MNTLPQVAPTVTVHVVSPLQVIEARTPDQLWFDGFSQYADDVRTGDYCTAEEVAAMLPAECRGYNDAISAADYAETNAYLFNTNAYGDRTEF